MGSAPFSDTHRLTLRVPSIFLNIVLDRRAVSGLTLITVFAFSFSHPLFVNHHSSIKLTTLSGYDVLVPFGALEQEPPFSLSRVLGNIVFIGQSR